MSYQAGIGPGLRRIGMLPCEPHLYCDGCATKRPVSKPGGMPYAWFMDRKKAPGWTMVLEGDRRRDYCQACTEKQKASK